MSDLIITEKSNITAVADNIRSLTGTTGALTLGQMATIKGSGGGTSEDLTAVLDTQETKLNELLEVLDGKAAGGGGTGEDLSAEIATQKQLIADIQTALEGKATGGSDGGSAVETCMVLVNVIGIADDQQVMLRINYLQYSDEDDKKNLLNFHGTNSLYCSNVICDSLVVFTTDTYTDGLAISNSDTTFSHVEHIGNYTYLVCVHIGKPIDPNSPIIISVE